MSSPTQPPAPDWIRQMLEVWDNTGGRALQSRGEFLVGMDGSEPVLEFCRFLARQNWPWSSTRIVPVRENWVPPDHQKNIAHRIYKALYPRKAEVLRWRTQHIEPESAAREFGRRLHKSGDRPKIDLCLLANSGPDSLADCLALEEAAEFELAAVYPSSSTRANRLALTPWALEPARSTILLETPHSPIPPDSLLHTIIKQAGGQDRLYKIPQR